MISELEEMGISRGIRGWVRSPLKWDKMEKFWDGKC